MKRHIPLFATALLSSYATSMKLEHNFDQIAQMQFGEIAAEHMLTESELLELAQTLETIPVTGSEQGNSALTMSLA